MKQPDFPQLKLHRGTSLFVRDGRGDDALMVKECVEHYRHFDLRDTDVVLDLGVNIGGFTKMCLDADVFSYVGVEPDPENLEIAQINAGFYQQRTTIEWLQGVASAGSEPTLEFNQSESGYAKCSGSIVHDKRSLSKRTIHYSVPNFQIDALFAKYRPTILKMDIEGAEYDWFRKSNGVFPEHIREVAIDLHKKTGIKEFEEKWLDTILRDFDVVEAVPNVGFVNSGKTYSIKKLKLSGKGILRALDIFLKRKTQ